MSKNLVKIRTINNEENGCLSFAEINTEIPFEIKRLYYIYGVPEGKIRGHHAHKSLNQLLVCLNGEVEIETDDGVCKESVLLDSPSKGLIVSSGIWRTMKFNKKDSILMVAASDFYSEDDYIRDYDNFIKLMSEGYWR